MSRKGSHYLTKGLLKKINSLRFDLGIPVIVSGNKNCLRCGKRFYAQDKKNEGYCVVCKKYVKYSYVEEDYTFLSPAIIK